MAVVVVTGSSSGFGLLTTVELARRGHQVFATMRDPGRRGPLDEALAAAGVEAEVVQLDVTDDGSVRTAITHVTATAGRIDVLVNNAGIAAGAAIEETSIADFMSVFETNVLGTLRMTQAVLPIMRAQQAGHIVNVTSIAAFVSPPFMGAYAASKHAVDALGEALAGEVAPFGIHVTNVAPGAYETAMLADVDAALAAVTPDSPYADRLTTMLERHLASMRENSTPVDVAIAVADAVDGDPPPGRVVVPAGSSFIVEARGATPPEQLRQLLARSYGI